jgi:hypothetical protein
MPAGGTFLCWPQKCKKKFTQFLIFVLSFNLVFVSACLNASEMKKIFKKSGKSLSVVLKYEI